MTAAADRFDLERFVKAQARVYAHVVAELRGGRKRSHWMWFIFPQLRGLGVSPTAQFYGIGSAEEARAYLVHPVLGPRLIECTETVLGVPGTTLHEIFGSPDALKFRSCMTLFARIAPERDVFRRALEKYCGEQEDDRTVALLAGVGLQN